MPLRASQTQPRGWRSTTPHPARTPPSIHWWCKILDSTPVVTSMYCNTDSSLDYVLHDSDQMYDCTLFFVRFPSPHASRGIDGSIDGSFRWLFFASCFLLQTREHRRVAILCTTVVLIGSHSRSCKYDTRYCCFCTRYNTTILFWWEVYFVHISRCILLLFFYIQLVVHVNISYTRPSREISGLRLFFYILVVRSHPTKHGALAPLLPADALTNYRSFAFTMW